MAGLPAMELMEVRCPPGAVAGQHIVIDANGQHMQVEVPAGVQPGQPFQIHVPAAQQAPAPVVMATEVTPGPGYGGQPGYGGHHGGGWGGHHSGSIHVHHDGWGGRKRLSQEGWCWVIILFLVFWPICWLPFVMEQCYESY